MAERVFRSYLSVAKASSLVAKLHSELVDFYIGEPIRHKIYREECEHVARINADGYLPSIEMPSFEDWKKL